MRVTAARHPQRSQRPVCLHAESPHDPYSCPGLWWSDSSVLQLLRLARLGVARVGEVPIRRRHSLSTTRRGRVIAVRYSTKTVSCTERSRGSEAIPTRIPGDSCLAANHRQSAPKSACPLWLDGAPIVCPTAEGTESPGGSSILVLHSGETVRASTLAQQSMANQFGSTVLILVTTPPWQGAGPGVSHDLSLRVRAACGSTSPSTSRGCCKSCLVALADRCPLRRDHFLGPDRVALEQLCQATAVGRLQVSSSTH